MSIIIRPSHAYAFLFGLGVGKFTNLFSDIVISGLVLYIVTPNIYTEERITKVKNYFWSWINPSRITQSTVRALPPPQTPKLNIISLPSLCLAEQN